MNPNETAQLIEAAGGDSAFARLLGIGDMPYSGQRVNNWKRRGMPASVILEHYDVISALKKVAASPHKASA